MIEKDILEKHIQDKVTCEQLTLIFNCCKNTIKNYLKKYNISTPKGFYKRQNKIAGRPKNIPCTDEQRKYLSEKFKGENNPFFGKNHSIESKQKMIDNHADFNGEKNPFKKSLKNENKIIEHKNRCCEIWRERKDDDYNLNYSKRFRTGHGQIPGGFWSRVKANAKTRGLQFSVDIKYCWDLFNLQNGICALSGVELSFSNILNNTTASLDRIENNLGYVEGNVQWVHKTVNLMKRNLKEEEFIRFCKKINEFNNNNNDN